MGRGRFSFGVATASAQVEDQNDWYVWTLPVAMGGLGYGRAPLGDAVLGFTNASLMRLAADLGVDSYRFSMEWSRIEPRSGRHGLAHYGRVCSTRSRACAPR